MNLKSGKFYSSAEYEYSPEIVFTYALDHDFVPPSEDDLLYMETIRERLFCSSLGENTGDYFMLQIARGLAGDVMKRILFGLGVSNSGKGVLSKAILLSCGQYAGSFNAENMSFNKSSNDEAQKMRWAFAFKDKRIILSNEITNDIALNGNMIKKLASGGDTLVGRVHGGLETEYIPQFLPIILANDLPKIKPYDDAVNNRVRVGTFEKTFVENPKNEYELKMDCNLEIEMTTMKFQQAFVNLLVKTYTDFIKNGSIESEPAEVIRAKCDWIGEESEHSVIGKFLEDYEITNNQNDFVRSEDVTYWLTNSNDGISSKKFGLEFKKHCAINKFDNVVSKMKSIAGKKISCWFGMKRLGCEEDTGDNKTELY